VSNPTHPAACAQQCACGGVVQPGRNLAGGRRLDRETAARTTTSGGVRGLPQHSADRPRVLVARALRKPQFHGLCDSPEPVATAFTPVASDRNSRGLQDGARRSRSGVRSRSDGRSPEGCGARGARMGIGPRRIAVDTALDGTRVRFRTPSRALALRLETSFPFASRGPAVNPRREHGRTSVCMGPFPASAGTRSCPDAYLGRGVEVFSGAVRKGIARACDTGQR
jgi:hypothetical protein